MEIIERPNLSDMSKQSGVEPAGPLVEVTYLDDTSDIVTLAEANALRDSGKLKAADPTDTRALSEDDVYGTTDV
jgi:hypothetical protein